MAKSSNKWLERYTDGGLYIPLEGTSYVVRQQISKPRTYEDGGLGDGDDPKKPKTVIYNDYNKYLKAKQAYNDSLNLYNAGVEKINFGKRFPQASNETLNKIENIINEKYPITPSRGGFGSNMIEATGWEIIGTGPAKRGVPQYTKPKTKPKYKKPEEVKSKDESFMFPGVLSYDKKEMTPFAEEDLNFSDYTETINNLKENESEIKKPNTQIKNNNSSSFKNKIKKLKREFFPGYRLPYQYQSAKFPFFENGGLNDQDPPVESLRSATTYSVTPQNFVPIKRDAKTQNEIELLQKSINERTKNTPEFKQARKLTKEEQDYSDKVKARMKNPSADLGILAANMASAFTRLQYLTPDEIKKITNNPKGTIKVAADILEQGLINELTGGALTALSKAAPQAIKSVGKYLTEGPLKNTYKLNPSALKKQDVDILYRWDADVPFTPFQGSTTPSSKYTGKWATTDKSNVLDYMRLRPGSGTMSSVAVPKGLSLLPEDAAKFVGTSSLKDIERIIPENYLTNLQKTRVVENPFDILKTGNTEDVLNAYKQARQYIKEPTPHWLKGYPVEVPKSTSNSNYPFFKSITGNPEYINTEHLAALIKRETDWLRSPEYVKRKMAATGKSEQAIKEESEKIINNINNTSIEYTGKSEDWAAGVYAPNVSGKNPKISVFNGTVDNAYHDGVLRHEVGHAFSEMGNPSDNLIRFLKNEGYRNYPKVNLNKTIKDKISSIFGNSWANLAPEQQITARRMMDIIEETQGLKRGTYLTEDNVKKLINHLKSDKFNVGDTDVIQVMSKFKRKFGEGYSKQLKDFLNKAYVISGIGVAGAAALEQQKENGDWLNKYEQGGYADDSAVLNSEGQEVNTMQFALPTVPTFNFGNGNGNGNGDGEDPKDKKKSKDKKTDTRTIGQKRHDALEAAKTKILKTESPENKKKMDMLYSTTIAAENTYGYDPNAYGRKKQTRSPMSIDNIALDELFNPKGEKNRYTLQQKLNFDLLRSLGLPTDKAKLKELLETDDAYAGLGVAKTLYYNEGALKNLPNPTDTAAYINLYLNEYNKSGALKYQKRNELIDNITNKMRAEGKRKTKTIKPVVKNKTTK